MYYRHDLEEPQGRSSAAQPPAPRALAALFSGQASFPARTQTSAVLACNNSTLNSKP